MHPLDSVFAHIHEHRDEFLERLFDYLRQPSISAYGVGVLDTAAYLMELLSGIGLDVVQHETAQWPILEARYHVGKDVPTVLFYGHYDVQPPDPLDAWVSPPFDPEIRDGRIYARGVGDNKGQHFANILAIESLLSCHGGLPCNVILVLEGEEETGSPHLSLIHI